MKQNMNYGDIISIVNEMQLYIGFRVQSIYDVSSTEFLIKLRNTIHKTYHFLNIKSGYYIHETEYPTDKRRTMPSGFVMTLRKYLCNKRISNVSILQQDRIIQIGVGEYSSKYSLVIELYGMGNILLLQNQTILAYVTHYEHIKKNNMYSPQPPHRIDISKPIENQCIHRYGKNISNEIMYILQNTYGDNYTSDDIQSVISELFNTLLSAKSHGYIIQQKQNRECVGYLYSYFDDTYTVKEFPSFNKSIDLFLKNPTSKNKSSNKKTLTKKKNSLEKIIEINVHKQNNIRKYIESLLGTITLMQDNQESVEQQLSNPELVVSGKDKLVKIRIHDKYIQLCHTKTFYQNIRDLYQKIKQKKIVLQKTIVGLEKAKKNVELHSKHRHIQKSIIHVINNKWYHDYHWFYTSNGFLVVCGKNSNDNETLVKKYMETHDIYFHSEVAGSGSCILKNPDKKEIPITDLEQSGQFVVCRSNAWKPKIIYNAYWVYPNQVSKTTETGEFVQKGAFIIRGKRNYIKNISFELGASIIRRDKEVEFMISPYRTILNQDKKNRLKITPGNHKRKKGIDKIIKYFNLDMKSYDIIDKSIPYHFTI